ncbi:MAG: hypothetical protein NZO41_02745 [Candidatus Bipolaricaulota bacterium]|nr:hypothetical protein [Candidatus Bipolaricaulota bacterium]MDW8141198.1 hypothetical protein [Candidatus Bipolaricaulota bacterium]
MKTTIELKKKHHALLKEIAARRGWRSCSRVIQEAIEFYLHHHGEVEKARCTLLKRKGAWSSEKAERARAAIAELREEWRLTTLS